MAARSVLRKAVIGGGTASGCLTAAIAATCIGLNIWNLAICAKGLDLTQSTCSDSIRLQAFFIGSIVCSAISLLTCGITVPVPQLVFAILGQAWQHTACGASSTFLSSRIHHSVIVLWFTFSANVLVIAFMCCLPCCTALGIGLSEDDADIEAR